MGELRLLASLQHPSHYLMVMSVEIDLFFFL